MVVPVKADLPYTLGCIVDNSCKGRLSSERFGC